MAAADTRVLSYGDVLLRASDVETLGPHGWLNDQVCIFRESHLQVVRWTSSALGSLLQVLSFYFEYLRREVLADANDLCILDVPTSFLLIHEGRHISTTVRPAAVAHITAMLLSTAAQIQRCPKCS